MNGNGLAELGLRKAEGAACLAFLLLGMMMALASIYFDNVKLTERACEEFRRLSYFRRTAALLELPTTTETMDRLGEQIKSLDTVLPQDFEFSPLALHLLHGAGGAWLAAVTLILIRIGIEAVGWF